MEYQKKLEMINLVSFFHKVNGLYLSRVQRFQLSTGPQGNLTTFFRGYYENVSINDSLNDKLKNHSMSYFEFKILHQNF